jgi:tellurite resistance protein TerC
MAVCAVLLHIAGSAAFSFLLSRLEGGKFFVRLPGNPKLYATPLLAVLLVIETTDLLFAVDSIPAVLAITLNASG